MTTTDEARAALLSSAGPWLTGGMVDALIAAVRAEYRHWHTVAEYEARLSDAEAKLAALAPVPGGIEHDLRVAGWSREVIARLRIVPALATTPAEPPKWDVLGAHDEMVRLHGESCDCDVCLVIQEKADAALAATPAESRLLDATTTQQPRTDTVAG